MPVRNVVITVQHQNAKTSIEYLQILKIYTFSCYLKAKLPIFTMCKKTRKLKRTLPNQVKRIGMVGEWNAMMG